ARPAPRAGRRAPRSGGAARTPGAAAPAGRAPGQAPRPGPRPSPGGAVPGAPPPRRRAPPPREGDRGRAARGGGRLERRASARRGAWLMDLYLIRHGIAEPRGTRPKDDERRLTPDGKKKLKRVVRGLERIGVKIDRLY